MEESLIEKDISCELWREYDWYGRIYRIHTPKTLFIKPGETTHRVVDINGVTHCVPSVGNLGCVLRWQNIDKINTVAAVEIIDEKSKNNLIESWYTAKECI